MTSSAAHESEEALSPRVISWVARVLGLTLACFTLEFFSFTQALSSGLVSCVIFLAEGVALAGVILWGRRVWPGAFLGQMLVIVMSGLTWPLALGMAAINTTEVLIGAWLFHRLGIRTAYDRLVDVGRLMGLIFFVLLPCSITLEVLLYWQTGVVSIERLQAVWFSQWLGNGLGLALMTPFILSWWPFRFEVLAFRGGFQRLQWSQWSSLPALSRKLWPVLCFVIVILVLSGRVHVLDAYLGFAMLAPLMVLLAAYYGMRVTTAFTLAMVFALQWGSWMSLGAFGLQGQNFLGFDLLFLSLALTGQFVSALIAECKTIEVRLDDRHRQLSEAQRIANLGSWTLTFPQKRLEWSDEIYRMLELDSGRVSPNESLFLERVHPDDRSLIKETYAQAIARNLPYECTHRLVFPDGRVKHVRARGEFRRNASGRLIEYYGTLLDVTPMVHFEERLTLYARIFSQTGEAIIVTDRDVNIIEVNSAFTQISGYTLDEVRGKNPSILASGRTPETTYRDMWQSLQERGIWSGELWDKRKNGEVYPKWASLAVLRDQYGEIINYYATFSDISERKAAEERVAQIAYHDTLTGLLNRFSLDQRLQQVLETACRNSGRLALMFLDMNRFKQVNDSLGHHVGDLLLIEVARRLLNCVRASDIVARLGGDEFVVVLTALPDVRSAVTVAEKIVECLGQPYLLEGITVESSTSIGISLYPQNDVTAAGLLHQADVAMYHAKHSGLGQYRFYQQGMTAQG